MFTDEQKKDAQRLARYIEREQLVSVMNDTRWRRLFNIIEPIQGWLEFRRKDVRATEGQRELWCGDFCHMLGGWKNIEWLEIKAIHTITRGAVVEP